jgi:DNA-binding GntR family transcriptional regulator
MPVSLQQRAYAHIYRKLANEELVPGDRLSNRALAKEIGISVIPVREAMNQLASKGLLDHQPGLGTFVPQPNAEEYLHLLEVREAVECHVVAKVAGRLSEAELAELEKQNQVLAEIVEEFKQSGRPAWDAQKRERWNVADAAFHMTLLHAAGNPRLLELVRDLRLMSRIMSLLAGPQPLETLASAPEGHSRIIAALRRGNPSEAREMMAQHIHARWSHMAPLLEQAARDVALGPDATPPAFVAPTVQERLREIEVKRPSIDQ